MYINPTPEQQQQFMAMPETSPLFMINMLKFNEGGQEKYKTYMHAVAPLIKEVGAKLIWSGKPMMGLIGPEDEMLWDAVLIVRYPNKIALAQLGGHPDYPGHLRAEALEDSRLIASSQLDFA